VRQPDHRERPARDLLFGFVADGRREAIAKLVTQDLVAERSPIQVE
jgi:hypothetical protein